MPLPDLFRKSSTDLTHFDSHMDTWMKSMRREFDRLFDQMMPAASTHGSHPFADYVPRVNASEDENAIHIEAELPGLTEKDVDVSLADGVLTIRGERKQETERKKRDYHTREWTYGSFSRSFTVPAEIDEPNIAALFKNGILTVDLPKSPEAKSKVKKIDVKPGQ